MITLTEMRNMLEFLSDSKHDQVRKKNDSTYCIRDISFGEMRNDRCTSDSSYAMIDFTKSSFVVHSFLESGHNGDTYGEEMHTFFIIQALVAADTLKRMVLNQAEKNDQRELSDKKAKEKSIRNAKLLNKIITCGK